MSLLSVELSRLRFRLSLALCSLDEDTGDIDELEEPMPYGESFRLSRLQLRLSLLLDFSRLVMGGDDFFSVSLVAVLK